MSCHGFVTFVRSPAVSREVWQVAGGQPVSAAREEKQINDLRQ